jgi:hypothetical protein
MQIFIIDNPLQTAISLDTRRFYAQIREAKIVLKWCEQVKSGEGQRWVNQPLVRMYINHMDWLRLYLQIFEAVRDGDMNRARILNEQTYQIIPNWHCIPYYTQMKRRLYTKNKSFYKIFEYLGESFDNWYWVDGKWKKIPQLS